ncbi:MAG: hypothetical protein KAT65_08445 [Methanophagales archaeon]|nr:hypothetical protein [Methanophagales archaeon]
MVLEDAANWAVVIGVPLTIISLIIAYKTLKNQINTIGTQINTQFDNISLQLNYQQHHGIQINYNVRGDVLNGSQINREYKKGVGEEREDE